MKKLIKNLSISLAVIAIAIVAVFGCISLVPKNGASNNSSTIVESDATGTEELNGTEQNGGTQLTANEVQNEIEFVTLSGVYAFDAAEYDFDDTYRGNSEEVLTYFNAKDFNGVYNVVKPLGFDDFVASLTSTVSFGITDNDVDVSSASNDYSGKMGFLFEGNNVYVVYIDENNNYYVDKSSVCAYTASEGVVTLLPTDGSTITYLEISYNDDLSQVTYNIHFSYYDDVAEENVITPLVVSTSLTKVENTDAILSSSSTQYAYSAGSTYLVSTSTTTLNYLDQVANIFGIENSENVMSDVLDILSGWSLSIDDDFSRIVLQNSDTSFHIIMADNGTYTINGVTFEITLHTIDFTNEIDILTMVITVDEYTTLTFEFNLD